MPFDFGELVSPAHTAVVTCEMQRGIIGDLAPTPELAKEVADLGVLGAAAELCRAARAAGVRVVHATVELRADRAGLSINNPMMAYVVKNPNQVLQGSPYAELCPELGPEPEDIEIRRIHGLTPFTGTELDPVLRNLGHPHHRSRRGVGQRGPARSVHQRGRPRLPHRAARRRHRRGAPQLRGRRRHQHLGLPRQPHHHGQRPRGVGVLIT